MEVIAELRLLEAEISSAFGNQHGVLSQIEEIISLLEKGSMSAQTASLHAQTFRRQYLN